MWVEGKSSLRLGFGIAVETEGCRAGRSSGASGTERVQIILQQSSAESNAIDRVRRVRRLSYIDFPIRTATYSRKAVEGRDDLRRGRIIRQRGGSLTVELQRET